jgi:hypothetical protein
MEEHMVEPSPSTTVRPLPVDVAAQRIGHHRWMELRLFETMGAWMSSTPNPAVQLHLASESRIHAWHAQLWADLLPSLPHLDPAELTTPPHPTLAELFEALNEDGGADPAVTDPTVERLVGAYRVLLPRSVTRYAAHLEATSPVTDGPVIRALELVLADDRAAWQRGERLVQSLVVTDAEIERAATQQARFERLAVHAP